MKSAAAEGSTLKFYVEPVNDSYYVPARRPVLSLEAMKPGDRNEIDVLKSLWEAQGDKALLGTIDILRMLQKIFEQTSSDYLQDGAVSEYTYQMW